MTNLYPLLFENNLHTIVWGGTQLEKWKGLPSSGKPISESWEVCAVASSPSVIAYGSFTGRSLPEVFNEHSVEILGKVVAEKYDSKLPLLAKFIDADRDLSIQVHPDDEKAMREHSKMGKTEIWYIIDAKPGAYLYAGFKDNLTPGEYARKVLDGTITDALAKHEVHSGDVFYLPAGHVHAICSGILLAEIQQSSDITYRIYVYNRLGLDGKPRELHTEMAARALDFKVYDDYRTVYMTDEDKANHYVDSEFFNVRVVNVYENIHRNLIKYDSFIITMCMKGRCRCIIKLRDEHLQSSDTSLYPSEILLKEGHSCLIPAFIADYDVIPTDGSCLLLDAFIDNKDRSLMRKATRFLHLTKK